MYKVSTPFSATQFLKLHLFALGLRTNLEYKCLKETLFFFIYEIWDNRLKSWDETYVHF
jgi:hypothetical protein